MGIVGVEKYLENYPDTCCFVDIRQAVKDDDRKVVVVDGNVFHHMYIFRKFQWICGNTHGLVAEVRNFVGAFNRLGVKLVFFFCDHQSKEVRRKKWIRDRHANMRYVKKVLRRIEQMDMSVALIGSLPEGESHTPLDIKCWLRAALQEIQCEVICPVSDRVYHIASYARENNCLAIISQTSYFVFYEDLTAAIWSMKHLDMRTMKTKAYNCKSLARRLHFENNFFPLLATLLGTTSMVKDRNRTKVRNCIRKRVSYALASDNMCDVTAQYIRENFDYDHLENVPVVLTKHFSSQSEMLVSDYLMYERMFKFKYITEDGVPNVSEMNLWEKIKKVCYDLQKRGRMCSKVRVILDEQFYEQHTMLEDFDDLPSISLLFRPLRQKIYAILLHEAEGFLKNREVKEWCFDNSGILCSTIVSPANVDKSIHPGLLNLWDLSNTSDGILENKWQLFANAVSSNLEYNLLRDLPAPLAIPTAVLFYLYREAPLIFPEYSCNLLSPWEIDVFISVIVTLPYRDGNFFRVIHRGNIRAIKLSALFMHGCQTMEMLHQACGYVVKEPNSIWYYFDGILFHDLYENAKVGYKIINSCCNPEILAQFELIRKIVFLNC
ncbi:Uncharacterized protein GBIM_06607 [Gryllus bimaculatus]|nr:Uncharacterized protein GBIM_06607 [Gryllus bimaculatus]